MKNNKNSVSTIPLFISVDLGEVTTKLNSNHNAIITKLGIIHKHAVHASQAVSTDVHACVQHYLTSLQIVPKPHMAVTKSHSLNYNQSVSELIINKIRSGIRVVPDNFKITA